ncbi:hypothetical protein EYF80_014371 [Liparis tanakae]|uniref:Uncharacterized protein n=1 Tax=Liparis tanakae TaxID=230148 RepID=A0A4Z2ID79_9TELE|nr:hypothetical protein EYF80_014371 [Liparis tanakae]
MFSSHTFDHSMYLVPLGPVTRRCRPHRSHIDETSGTTAVSKGQVVALRVPSDVYRGSGDEWL